jgi:glutaconate CoA-transferase subunit A
MTTHTRNKLIPLADAVRRFAFNGMQYASGAALPVGSDAIAFGRELVRQNIGDLHAIFHANTQQLNLLCAVGAVIKAECGYTGLEGFGFANGLRRSVESGQVVLEDYSNLAMAVRLLAGAMNWPFAPATVNIGSDVERRSAFAPDESPAQSKIPMIQDPFTGRPLGAFSPLKPDLAAIHVPLADPAGNAIMLGTEWSRFELSRAAKRVILIADNIVDTACMRQFPNLVRIPDLLVEAVVWWPFAAWPQASPGVYDGDEAHMKLMNQMLGSEDGTREYVERFVTPAGQRESYLELIGVETIAKLSAGPTAFLLDPYRRWLLPDATVRELEAANTDKSERLAA